MIWIHSESQERGRKRERQGEGETERGKRERRGECVGERERALLWYVSTHGSSEVVLTTSHINLYSNKPCYACTTAERRVCDEL